MRSCTYQQGVQQRKRRHPATASSTEPLATQRIRELNCKRPRLQDKDPYSSGMNSGRHAAPDVQSVAQNAEARERATLGMGPALSQTCKRGCKCASTPALAIPPSPTPLQSPWPYHVLHFSLGLLRTDRLPVMTTARTASLVMDSYLVVSYHMYDSDSFLGSL